jgi:predicted enzyme related to lactoylglutathione lyase
MSSFHGRFVWCELMTTDAAAATEFYRSVIGWNAKDAGMTGDPYTILSAGEVGTAGLMELPQPARDAGMRPGWLGYVWADDLDATAARVAAAGGAVHRTGDIPGVGRFAVVGDPQGAVLVLFHGMNPEQEPPPAGSTPGRVGWHELHATDREAAFAFYAGLFGWTKTDAIDMGAMGIYQLFATGGTTVGGMMTRQPPVPAPFWLYYFNVEAIGAAVDRVKAAGGQVLNGPHQVPGGSWIAQCMDPQGAMFAIVAPASQ